MRTIFANFEGAAVAESKYEEAEFRYVHNVLSVAKIIHFKEMRPAARLVGLADPGGIVSLTSKTAEALWNSAYGIRDFGPSGRARLTKDTAAGTGFAREHGIAADLIVAVRAANIGFGRPAC